MTQKDRVVDITSKHTYGTWRKQKGWTPLNVIDAEGCYFWDTTGKKYLDFSSQLMCSNLGHKNKAVIDAICDQARKLSYIGPPFATDTRSDLTEELLTVMPSGLDKFFYATSGTEANEAAIKIARLVTKKYKIISRYNSYHGSTSASISVTGDWRRWHIEPSGRIDGVIFAPDAYPYRCPLGAKETECGIACAQYVDYMIKNEGNVAAVIIEPVVGTNGVIVPPKQYLPLLREITQDNDVLLIADEVMSGWGRTGEWFAVDNWHVKPDILTTAKGITGAYVPLSVTATTRKVSEYFEDNFFAHGHTYEAHPLMMAPAIAAIREFKRLKLIEKAREMGPYIGKRLNELAEKHQSIGDVRGLGMFWAVEIVKNRETKKPFNTRADKFAGTPTMVEKISSEMMKAGVFIQNWISHFIIAPPLIATEEEIEEGLKVLDESLRIADRETSA
ncbi:MAG: aspartate aminotransferase family protein [Candidatus Bathyarchaeia archaeon]